MFTSVTIPLQFAAMRRRALEAQANVGTHAWDIKAAWDAETDAAAYCLDAVDSLPAGSAKGFVGRPIFTHTLREQF